MTTPLGSLPENEVPPEADYGVRCAKIEKREGKDHPYLNVEYKITDEGYRGFTLYDIISLSPKALWKIKLWLKVFRVEENQELPIEKGADGSYVIDDEGMEQTAKELVEGREAIIHGVPTKYTDKEGKDRTKLAITKYEASGGVQPWEREPEG